MRERRALEQGEAAENPRVPRSPSPRNLQLPRSNVALPDLHRHPGSVRNRKNFFDLFPVVSRPERRVEVHDVNAVGAFRRESPRGLGRRLVVERHGLALALEQPDHASTHEVDRGP